MADETLSVVMAGYPDSYGSSGGRCLVCGMYCDRYHEYAELHQGDEVLGDVCHRCLAMAPEDAADVMRTRAASLSGLASEIECLPDTEWPKIEALDREQLEELCRRQWRDEGDYLEFVLQKLPTESLQALARAQITSAWE